MNEYENILGKTFEKFKTQMKTLKHENRSPKFNVNMKEYPLIQVRSLMQPNVSSHKTCEEC